MDRPLAGNVPKPVEEERIMDKDISEEIKLLCHIRKTPNVLFGMFLEIVRQFYAEENNIPIETCGVKWDPDKNKTGIWINTEMQFEDENPEFRPAIYVKLSAIKYNSLTGRHDGKMNMDLQQGEFKFCRSGTGTVSFVHLASSAGQTTAISGATLDYLDAFSSIIRDDLVFDIFEVTSISPIVFVDESKERYKSTVTVTFSFQDTWALKLESPKLKTLIFRAGQNLMGSGIL